MALFLSKKYAHTILKSQLMSVYLSVYIKIRVSYLVYGFLAALKYNKKFFLQKKSTFLFKK